MGTQQYLNTKCSAEGCKNHSTLFTKFELYGMGAPVLVTCIDFSIALTFCEKHRRGKFALNFFVKNVLPHMNEELRLVLLRSGQCLPIDKRRTRISFFYDRALEQILNAKP